jgi:sugar O-acyltransferase (sialic acid O-acetyltransferase NeuD family)
VQKRLKKTKKIILVGAGGLAREVLGLLLDLQKKEPIWEILGFADDHPASLGTSVMGFPVLGRLEELEEVRKQQLGAAAPLYAVCAVGNPEQRRHLAERCSARGLHFATLIHPAAIISPFSSVGEGSVVFPYSIVEPQVKIGRHVLINKSSTIGHDAVLEDYATIAPGVNIGGNTTLGRGSQIGIGAALLQGIDIGEGCILGAGAVAICNLPPHSTCVGVPARVVKCLRKDKR